MNKTELRLKPHNLLPGVNVAEVWYDGALIGTVVGADGPGVRIISKHGLSAFWAKEADNLGLHCAIVHIEVRP